MLNYAQRIRHLWGVGISPDCRVHAACSRESKFDALKCIVLLTGFCFDSGSRNIVYMYPCGCWSWWVARLPGVLGRALGALLAVLGGLGHGVEDGGVLLLEGDEAEHGQLGEVVPNLGS